MSIYRGQLSGGILGIGNAQTLYATRDMVSACPGFLARCAASRNYRAEKRVPADHGGTAGTNEGLN
jgi:hypothetical protein